MNSEMNIPRLMTIRQIAATGLMPEHALRTLVKTGRAPSFKVGNRVLIKARKRLEKMAHAPENKDAEWAKEIRRREHIADYYKSKK